MWMRFKSGFGVVSVCGLVSTHTDTKPSRILPSSQTPVRCNLIRQSSRVSLLSTKRSTTLYTPPILHTLHSDTLVLTSLHTCQGQEHSRSKRRVETSTVRSTPTHKTIHQSQYSVEDSLLQLLKTSCVISELKYGWVSNPVLVTFLYVDLCPHTQTQKRHTFYLHHKHL